MAETRNTPEQQIEGQRQTIVKLTQRIKDLEIWERFAAFQISDCNMQPEVLETWMNKMLAKEAIRPPIIKK